MSQDTAPSTKRELLGFCESARSFSSFNSFALITATRVTPPHSSPFPPRPSVPPIICRGNSIKLRQLHNCVALSSSPFYLCFSRETFRRQPPDWNNFHRRDYIDTTIIRFFFFPSRRPPFPNLPEIRHVSLKFDGSASWIAPKGNFVHSSSRGFETLRRGLSLASVRTFFVEWYLNVKWISEKLRHPVCRYFITFANLVFYFFLKLSTDYCYRGQGPAWIDGG